MSDAPPLSGREKRHLRALAQRQEPVAWVGEAGPSEGAIRAIDEALAAHELVKVRMREPRDKHALAEALAAATRSALAGLVGHTAILYRPHPEAPKIALPRATPAA
jgi:RNA-binding protein